MYYNVYNPYYSTELYHHGILGQKWGIRRYQYEDGSLTPEGKKRYYKNSENARGGYTRAGKKWLKKEKEQKYYEHLEKNYGAKTARNVKIVKTGLKVTGAIIASYMAIRALAVAGGFITGAALRNHGKKIVDEVMKHANDLQAKPGGTQAFDNFKIFGAMANAEANANGIPPFAAKQLEYVAYGAEDIKNRVANAVDNVKYNAKYNAYRAKDWARGQAAPVRDVINKIRRVKPKGRNTGFYPPAVIR